MPKLPQIRPKRLVHALERAGFQTVRQKGSHVQMKNGNLLATVPIHSGDINLAASKAER
jgi:predicted RNA binding protein YcfA (HicA-like mRNA interferase family)